MSKRLFLSPPHMGREEREFLLEAFDSNWIAPLGPHVDAFEQEMCVELGVGHTAALSSGTAALHLALEMLGASRGADVWCSTLTFAASANAIRYTGATPVFVDSDEATWNMDPGLLQEGLAAAAARGRLPKAVIIVDLYGQCADYDALLPTCERYGVPVIEDAAEALGATYGDRCAGSFGEMAVLSFNGNKIITTSGGGMLLSNREDWVSRARFLATQARDPAPHYQHTELGYNYRMSNLLAAVGRGQLKHLEERVTARRRIHLQYREALGDIEGIVFMPEADYGRSTRWLTCITVEPAVVGVHREQIRLALEEENIEARPVWKPMHLQPLYTDCRVIGGRVSERLFEHGLCLPSGSAMTDGDLDRVVQVVRRVIES